MSPLAKVFVVINLFLAVAVLAVNATLFSAREKFVDTVASLKERAEQDATDNKNVVARLSGALAIQEKNNNAFNAKNQLLEQEVTQLRSELGDLRKQLGEAQATIAQKEQMVSIKEQQVLQKDKEIAGLRETKDTLTADALRANEAKTAADTARARAFLDRQQLQAELDAMAGELTQLEKTASENQALIEKAIAYGINFPEIMATSPPPAIDGTVVSVRPEADLVILSVGEHDRVNIGHEFTIYRGDRFIAKVRVIKVTEDLAGANILYTEGDGVDIQAGDKATTRIGLGLGG